VTVTAHFLPEVAATQDLGGRLYDLARELTTRRAVVTRYELHDGDRPHACFVVAHENGLRAYVALDLALGRTSADETDEDEVSA